MEVAALIALINGLISIALNLADTIGADNLLSVEAQAALSARRKAALKNIGDMTPED